MKIQELLTEDEKKQEDIILSMLPDAESKKKAFFMGLSDKLADSGNRIDTSTLLKMLNKLKDEGKVTRSPNPLGNDGMGRWAKA